MNVIGIIAQARLAMRCIDCGSFMGMQIICYCACTEHSWYMPHLPITSWYAGPLLIAYNATVGQDVHICSVSACQQGILLLRRLLGRRDTSGPFCEGLPSFVSASPSSAPLQLCTHSSAALTFLVAVPLNLVTGMAEWALA